MANVYEAPLDSPERASSVSRWLAESAAVVAAVSKYRLWRCMAWTGRAGRSAAAALVLAAACTALDTPALGQVYFTGSIGMARLDVDVPAPELPSQLPSVLPPTFEQDVQKLFDSLPGGGGVDLALGGFALGVEMPGLAKSRAEVQLWSILSSDVDGTYYGGAIYKDLWEGEIIPYIGVGGGYTDMQLAVDGVVCEEETILGGMVAYGFRREIAEMTDIGLEIQHFFFEDASYECSASPAGTPLTFAPKTSYEGPLMLSLRFTRRF